MVYMGSKARLAKHIAPIIQSYITDKTVGYLEPFVGGANMIQHIKHPKRYGSDISDSLIALLKYSQDLSNKLPDYITEDEYNKVKQNKKDYPLWYVGFCGFIAAYGPTYFTGYAKDLPTRSYIKERIANLEDQRNYLTGINFKKLSYTAIRDIKNFVIYCDPPYYNTYKYSSDKDFCHDNFWNWVRYYSKKNVVLVSEYNAPVDFELLFEKDLITSIGPRSAKQPERLFKWKN